MTVTLSDSSGLFAGPLTTEPSVIENLLPWQVQSMSSPSISATTQPWWVHTALNALKSPSVGWVTTTLSAAKILPPPTGTSEVLPMAPAAVVLVAAGAHRPSPSVVGAARGDQGYADPETHDAAEDRAA